MMLPQLQDIANFDAPEFGVDLTFLGNNESDERLYLQDLADLIDTPLEDYNSELGKCAVKSGRSKQACISQARKREWKRKSAAKSAKPLTGWRKPKSSAAPLSVIRGEGRQRRYPTRKPKPTREEKIRGVVERGVEEQQVRAGVDPQHLRLAREDALNAISKRFRADIMPKLNAIYKMVDQSTLQTSATNEHNVIMNTQAYRRKVLNDIAIISARLPKGHPLRNRLAARRRSLGLY